MERGHRHSHSDIGAIKSTKVSQSGPQGDPPGTGGALRINKERGKVTLAEFAGSPVGREATWHAESSGAGSACHGMSTWARKPQAWPSLKRVCGGATSKSANSCDGIAPLGILAGVQSKHARRFEAGIRPRAIGSVLFSLWAALWPRQSHSGRAMHPRILPSVF